MKTCGAKTRSGAPCAGRPMPNGRCRMHGGPSTGTGNLKHGLRSIKYKTSLQAKADAFLNDPAPADLTSELALQRAMLQEYLSRFDQVSMRAEDIMILTQLVNAVSSLVERISRILNQTAVTQIEVGLLAVRVANLLVQYVDPERLDDALRELESVPGLGGRGPLAGAGVEAVAV